MFEDESEYCVSCDNTGVRKFCPSWPDQCRGCEEEPCECRERRLELRAERLREVCDA